MKSLILLILSLSLLHSSFSQYFYKDIVAAREAESRAALLRKDKVRTVQLSSFEADGTPTEGFTGTQTVSPDFLQITTRLTSPVGGESQLVSQFNAAGKLVRTIDTADAASSRSDYTYDAQGALTVMNNLSISGGPHLQREAHVWKYNEERRPAKLLRIKNGADTITVEFVLDEHGLVGEERSRHKGRELPVIYYYYDEEKRLTDIAEYNQKARRILPSHVFEYDDQGRVSSMLVVPEGSTEYQKWVYEYNSSGLKVRETCYDKKKSVLGKIEYKYN
jgi:YD repeat-containing protein